MSSTTIKIALHGLIALVPSFVPQALNSPTGVNYMTALVVNGITPHSADSHASESPASKACMNSTHYPMLEFLAAASAECLDAKCVPSAGRCRCGEAALSGMHIYLEFNPNNPTPVNTKLGNHQPANELPANRFEAGNFSYVANMAHAPFSLLPIQGYDDDVPPPSLPQSLLLARFKTPFSKVTACSLAIREDGGESWVHALAFRKLHYESRSDDMSQALAQKIILELPVPDDTTEVRLVLRKFDDPDENSVRRILLQRTTDSDYKIDLSNHPKEALALDDPCNDGVARHFDRFYDLTNAPPTYKRLYPAARTSQARSAEELKPDICKDPTFGLIDRPICPMVSFNP